MASTKVAKGGGAPLERTTNEKSRNVPVDDPCGVGGDMRTLVKQAIVCWTIHENV